MTDELEQRLKELVAVFLIENAKVNLSAFRTEEKCWVGNVLDSLAALELKELLTDNSQLSIVDIGTGGGFPLLPLAMALPEVQFTGLDATQKKIDAVGRIVNALELKNVHLICGRTEILSNDPKYREQFDIVTARAVAEINVLLEYAALFAKVGGRIILWKSMDIDQELKESLNAQRELSCTLVDQHVYELPDGFGKRQLLIFEKTKPLDKKYPRGVGVAKKKPL